MAGKNDFLPFAVNGDANVATQAEYASSEEQLKGMQPGMASSKLCNKVWRQASLMASTLAQFIADQGVDVLDDGDSAALKRKLVNALKSAMLRQTYSGSATDSEIAALIRPGDLYIREG